MSHSIDYLANWGTLNAHIQQLDEDTVRELLRREQLEQARPAFLLRLYGRFNTLRTQRERRELMSSGD